MNARFEASDARGTRRRIEMVLPSLDTGGQELLVYRLANALRDVGFDVGITCTEFEGSLAPRMRADGFDVAIAMAPGLRTNIRAEALVRRFESCRPDVVHIHSGVWLKAARAAKAAGVRRVIHTVHGLLDREPWYSAMMMRLAARSTDLVVTVSEPLERFIVGEVGVDASRVQLVLNGVDTNAFRPGGDPRALRKRLGVPGDGPVIGHVARLAPIKNQRLLLDAFAGLLHTHPDAALVIVGDGPERGTLEERIASLGIGASVRLLGELADTISIYRDFDLFALTSRAEGTSVSILEAMASGVCIVATAVGGTPALLDGGRCGSLVPPDDTAALTGAFASLLDDADQRTALGAAGRAHVDRAYSASAMLERYIEVYGFAAAESPGMATRCAE